MVFAEKDFQIEKMKKLLFIPLDYDKNPNPDFFKALSCLFGTELFGRETHMEYDYVFCQFGAVSVEVLQTVKETSGAKVIMWTGDARAGLMDNVTQYKGVCDLALLAVGIGQWGIYEAAMDCPVDYMQQGVFNSFFIEPRELFGGGITFIGNNYDHFFGAVERTELCRMLAKEFTEFETIGSGFGAWHNNKQSCTYEQSAIIYNRSYISISHACFNDIEGYYSNRTLDIMAAGGCCLMRYTPNIQKWLYENAISENAVVYYHSNEDCIEKINMMKNDPITRNEIAALGHKRAKEFHTFNHRAKELKQLIEKYSL